MPKKEVKQESKEVQLSVKLDEELKTEIDVYCAQKKVTIKEFAREAFIEKLDK